MKSNTEAKPDANFANFALNEIQGRENHASNWIPLRGCPFFADTTCAFKAFFLLKSFFIQSASTLFASIDLRLSVRASGRKGQVWYF